MVKLGRPNGDPYDLDHNVGFAATGLANEML
jgi:hypothetical protein